MPRLNLHPCSLCLVPNPKSSLDPHGVCIRCVDSKEEFILESLREGLDKERYQETSWEQIEASIKASAKAREAALRRREEEERIQAELKKRDEADAELASRALARRSLLHYVERRVPGYKAGWVHEDIARRIEEFVEKVERGESPRLILQVAPRSGKALSNQTLMFTFNRGWTTHGDLKAGDLVADIEGNPTEVVWVGPETPCDVEITFNTKETIMCHDEHEWIIYNQPHANWEIMEAQRILTSARGTPRKLWSGIQGKRGSHCLYKVPTPPPIHVQEDIELPMDPYALGVWLGDGTSNAPRITHHPNETEVIEELVRRGYERSYACHSFAAGSTQTAFASLTPRGHSRMREELRTAGVFNNKHIPEIYLRASDRQRLELLAGLVDTDGHVDKTSRIQFTTSSEALKGGYLKLVRSLGQRPYVSETAASLSSSGIQGQKPYWTVTFQPTRDDIPTILPRKRVHRTLPSDKVSIVNVQRTQNPELGRCIQVASPYGVYLAGETFIPTHNSELASISGPAWILGRHPDWTILLTSYSDELPISWSRSVREQLKSEEFKTLFPSGGVVSKIDAGAKAWSTEQGGGVRASGVGGSILGFGAQIVVVDDPIKGAEEADSPGLLEKNWDWATSALYSRLMPGGGLIIIQQRWSNEDLVGRFISQMEAELQEIEDLRASAAELRAKPNADDLDLQEASNYEREAQELEDSMDRWDVVTYPALAEKDEYLSPEGEIIRFSPYEEVPTNYKPLRKTGEALHPERFGRNYFLKIKRANPRRFAALYQQTPIVDEGQYFAAGDLKRYSWRELPAVQFMNKFCAWDLAIGTKQSNDYTVGLVGAFDHEGRLWLLERIRGRFGDLEKVADMVMDLHLKHDAIITGIERTHLEMALHPILKRKMREQNKFILLAEGKDALKPISDKFVRARQLQALAKAGMVYVPDDDSWNEFVQELTRFGSTKTDDQVDAAAWLTIMAAKYSLPDNPSGTAKVEKSWYEAFMDEYLTNASEGKTFMAS